MQDRYTTYREFIESLNQTPVEVTLYTMEHFYNKYRSYLRFGFLMPPFLKKRWWKNRFDELNWTLAEEGISRSDCLDLLVQKNTQYSSKPLLLVGTRGIAVRSLSKIMRIQNMGGESKKDDVESIKDNVMDLYNYSILSLLLLEGKLI